MRRISVHGRFQPFHRGHLEYVEAACRDSGADEIVVGITQFQSDQLRRVDDDAATHRAERLANPLTFHERSTMIEVALSEAELPVKRWTIVPFPIESPTELHEFLPVDVPIYTTTYDSWNKTKIELLQAHGYTVHNLWDRDVKEYQGSELRRRMIAGEASWRDLVTPQVAAFLESIDIQGRLRQAVQATRDAGLAAPAGQPVDR